MRPSLYKWGCTAQSVTESPFWKRLWKRPRATGAAFGSNLIAVKRSMRVPLSLLATGFNQARWRLGDSSPQDADAGFRAPFEVLAWAGALNDRLKDRADLAPELRGLWFVRNLVLHAGADVVLRT